MAETLSSTFKMFKNFFKGYILLYQSTSTFTKQPLNLKKEKKKEKNNVFVP